MMTDSAEYMIQEFEKIRVLIAYDGVVHWEPGGVFLSCLGVLLVLQESGVRDKEKCSDLVECS